MGNKGFVPQPKPEQQRQQQKRALPKKINISLLKLVRKSVGRAFTHPNIKIQDELKNILVFMERITKKEEITEQEKAEILHNPIFTVGDENIFEHLRSMYSEFQGALASMNLEELKIRIENEDCAGMRGLYNEEINRRNTNSKNAQTKPQNEQTNTTVDDDFFKRPQKTLENTFKAQSKPKPDFSDIQRTSNRTKLKILNFLANEHHITLTESWLEKGFKYTAITVGVALFAASVYYGWFAGAAGLKYITSTLLLGLKSAAASGPMTTAELAAASIGVCGFSMVSLAYCGAVVAYWNKIQGKYRENLLHLIELFKIVGVPTEAGSIQDDKLETLICTKLECCGMTPENWETIKPKDIFFEEGKGYDESKKLPDAFANQEDALNYLKLIYCIRRLRIIDEDSVTVGVVGPMNAGKSQFLKTIGCTTEGSSADNTVKVESFNKTFEDSQGKEILFNILDFPGFNDNRISPAMETLFNLPAVDMLVIFLGIDATNSDELSNLLDIICSNNDGDSKNKTRMQPLIVLNKVDRFATKTNESPMKFVSNECFKAKIQRGKEKVEEILRRKHVLGKIEFGAIDPDFGKGTFIEEMKKENKILDGPGVLEEIVKIFAGYVPKASEAKDYKDLFPEERASSSSCDELPKKGEDSKPQNQEFEKNEQIIDKFIQSDLNQQK